MVTAPDYRHVPTGTLAILAQRLGKVWAAPSTWSRLVQQYGWRRPRLRVHPAKPKIGLRTTRADEMWHIDTTVIRLLDGTRAYLHAVIDNFSRRILAWRVAATFAPVNSVAVLVEASRGATRSQTTPVVLADAGVENVNAEVDDLITTGVLRRVLAFTELKFSNSMIEAWWRSLKHQWLVRHPLDSVATCVAWSRSTSTNITAYFPIRRFTDRRLTRCTSAPGRRYRPTCSPARPPRAGLALMPTDRHRARHARQSTRPRDREAVCRPDDGTDRTLAGRCVRRRSCENRRSHVARRDRQTGVRN
jgi:hypothetical protein